MRLKHIHISDYKNLKNFDLSFDTDSGLDVFVGKNGSGKSNLLEAIIEIFRHLNELGSGGDDIDFDYRITYEIEEKSTSVEWTSGQLKINGRNRKTLGKTTPLPDNILVYYSGHNDAVTALIDKYENTFRRNLKSADASESRLFFDIGSNYKELLLTTILLLPKERLCRQYICERLGIQDLAPDLKISLERPYYALGKNQFDISNDDPETEFWGAVGSTKEFLNVLKACATIQSGNGKQIIQGYLANEDKYSVYINCQKLRDSFSDKEPHELFHAFDKLKVLGMLEGISVELKLSNGENAYPSHFSDGQFQSVYIYALTELFKARHCLTLLDEPDSFLHPEWQHQFLDQVSDISDAATKTNHTLLCSHSAVTLITHKEEKIRTPSDPGPSAGREPRG